MDYIQVQVPEDDLHAVYEVLLARSSGRTALAPAGAVAPDDHAAAATIGSDTAMPTLLPNLWADVSDEGRAVLVALARRPGERLDMTEIRRVSGVENVGAAMQSIRIRERQSGMSGTDLIEKRRDNKRRRLVYTMSPQTAANILTLAPGA
jgi:hypothetical protein